MLQIHIGYLRKMTAISSRGDCIGISVLSMRLLTKMATPPLARRFVSRFLKNPWNPRIEKVVVLGNKKQLVGWQIWLDGCLCYVFGGHLYSIE